MSPDSHDLNTLFEHLPQYRILRCRQCCFAIVPTQLKAHLRKSHSTLSPQARQSIVKSACSLRRLAYHPEEVIYPDPDSHIIPGLACWSDAFQCSVCTFICCTLHRIQDHCRSKHAWKNQQHRGGDKRAQARQTPNAMWSDHITVQQFFRAVGWRRYFVVMAPTHPRPSTHNESLSAFFQAQEAKATQESNSATVAGFDEHRSAVLPWLRTTGIITHIQGLDKEQVRRAIALPSDKEHRLQVISAAVLSLLQTAHSGCLDGPRCRLTWQCRVLLSRFQPAHLHISGKIRAFDPYKEPGSLKTYFANAQRLFAYIDRVGLPEGDAFFTQPAEGSRPEDSIAVTDVQARIWAEIRTAADIAVEGGQSSEHMAQLQRLLLQMYLSLVRHRTGPRRFASLLTSYCAMHSIRASTGSWMEPGDFSSHLSATIWIAQLLVWYDCTQREANGEGSALELLQEVSSGYIQQTVETPLGEILRWRLLLLSVSKDTVSQRQATWDPSEQVVTLGDTELHLLHIPHLLQSTYDACRGLLYRDLLFGLSGLLALQPWMLKDNLSNAAVGWNFQQHPENKHLLQGANTTLLSAIRSSPRLCKLYVQTDTVDPIDTTPATPGAWRPNAIAVYEAVAQSFLQRLAVLVHTSSGQPLRESEFFSITWRNTQRLRAISIQYGKLMIHTQYHKTQQQSGRLRDNIRFVHSQVAGLLLDYIVYVLPLRHLFLQTTHPDRAASPHLWEHSGSIWTDNSLSRYIEACCVRAAIPTLHIATWRQISVAIVKTKFADYSACFEPDKADQDAEEISDDIVIMTKQRNHTVRTANRAYANQSLVAYANVWDGLIRMGLRASTLWQDFWRMDALLAPHTPSRKRPRAEAEAEDGGALAQRTAVGLYQPRRVWLADALLPALRKLFGTNAAEWKSTAQAQALAAIMRWESQVVVVQPTSAGKSLLFMLPCTLPDARVSILILPLVALRLDMLRRLRELDIQYLHWQPEEQGEAPLVLVSVEQAAQPGFIAYARRLIAQQRLDRIIVDECHLTVTAVEYRPAFTRIGELRALRTQFVYLTATLPPSMQAEFEQRNYLSHPLVLRTPGTRPNIHYTVCTPRRRNADLLQSCAKAAMKWMRSYNGMAAQDRILLYANTKQDARTLADHLDCGVYTADIATVEARQAVLATWLGDGGAVCLVATQALAEGFDYPHIRMVVNAGPPDSLVMFSQQSGRAGRDGRVAWSVIWTPEDPGLQQAQPTASTYRGAVQADIQDPSLRKQRERQAMSSFLSGQQCMRSVLSSYLDGVAEQRCRPVKDVPCTFCVGHASATSTSWTHSPPRPTQPSGAMLIQREKIRQQSEMDAYILDLTAVQGICCYCRATDRRWDHPFTQCPLRFQVFQARERARRYAQTRGKEWLHPYTACYTCLNPQSICRRAELRLEACTHPDVVLPLCCAIADRADGLAWIAQYFQHHFTTQEELFTWLGEPTTWGSGQAIQAVRVAARILQSFRGADPGVG